jgi:hypothetical protein
VGASRFGMFVGPLVFSVLPHDLQRQYPRGFVSFASDSLPNLTADLQIQLDQASFAIFLTLIRDTLSNIDRGYDKLMYLCGIQKCPGTPQFNALHIS